MKKKLILSGGWSYGNLGDEAILMASVNLLHERFPGHKIIVLLYRQNETVGYLEKLDYVEIGRSLHSCMYGVEEKRMDFGYGLAGELIKPIERRLNNRLNPIRQEASEIRSVIVPHLQG